MGTNALCEICTAISREAMEGRNGKKKVNGMGHFWLPTRREETNVLIFLGNLQNRNMQKEKYVVRRQRLGVGIGSYNKCG